MTTVACDGLTIACDSQVTWGDSIEQGCYTKIKKEGDLIFAYSGCVYLFEPWIKWWKDGKDPEKRPIVDKDNARFSFWCWDGSYLWEVQYDPPYPMKMKTPCAIGSGRGYALAAMLAGADARKAVEIAIKLDTGSGGEVYHLPLTGVPIGIAKS